MLDLLPDLLPETVATAEEFGDLIDAYLFPEEAAAVARAVDRRRREFATGRACARRALGLLGLPAVPVLPGERGAPVWPSGVVGSLTHCDGYRGVALAHRDEVWTIGIDAEPDKPLPDGVAEAVALEIELKMISELQAYRSTPNWDRMLFSAKEAVYKAWYPVTRIPLGFDGARIEFDPDDGTFSAELLVPGPFDRFTGVWLAARGLVLTAIVV
jgi:4'-phosphopantetheinyl transferase EntD